MKNKFYVYILIAVLGTGSVFAQQSCQPPIYFFNDLTVLNGSGGVNSSYRFNNVLEGYDAYVTITKAQNATTSNSNMDQSAGYSVAWQPHITFPSRRTNASDSSYLEFRVEFRANAIPGSPLAAQECMAMTVVDLDGANSNSSFRELLKVSNPATPLGIQNSTISVSDDVNWVTFKSGVTTFNNIDTANKAAMSQINFPPTTQVIYMRVGVVGPVSPNTVRQFSFYFKSFAGLEIPLPVQLNHFKAVLLDQEGQIHWNASSEKNFSHYEIYRSETGSDYRHIGSVAKGSEQNMVNSYLFADPEVLQLNADYVFYKLKIVDIDGEESWSFPVLLDKSGIRQTNETVLYPNPSSSNLNIELGYVPDTELSVTISDLYGKTVNVTDMSFKGSNGTMDISSLDAGVYVVSILHFDGFVENRRFIKN